MRWSSLLEFVARAVHRWGAPAAIIIQLGENDIPGTKGRRLINMMTEDLLVLHQRLPRTVVFWSELLSRRSWRSEKGPAVINRAKTKVNRAVYRVIVNFGGRVIWHPDIDSQIEALYRHDGVHLSDWGMDLWLHDVRWALFVWLYKLGLAGTSSFSSFCGGMCTRSLPHTLAVPQVSRGSRVAICLHRKDRKTLLREEFNSKGSRVCSLSAAAREGGDPLKDELGEIEGKTFLLGFQSAELCSGIQFCLFVFKVPHRSCLFAGGEKLPPIGPSCCHGNQRRRGSAAWEPCKCLGQGSCDPPRGKVAFSPPSLVSHALLYLCTSFRAVAGTPRGVPLRTSTGTMVSRKKELTLQMVVNNQELWEEMLCSRGLIVVDVYQCWCGPCKMIVNLFRKIRNELGDDLLHFAVAEADSVDALEKYRGKCEPTFLFFAGGELVAVVRGANAPLLQKTILEQLEAERKVLTHGVERVVIQDEAFLQEQENTTAEEYEKEEEEELDEDKAD
ncbi:thioredoxin domain-containing protein 6 [Paroedura picta]|uniref:thioredoxin domain-containing protein 6 n=1 Tax=Paroedura picta TaxID=143630 RepID=UPI004055E5CB